MALVAQLANTGMVTLVGLLVWFYLRGRFEESKQDTNRHFDELKDEMNRRSEQNDRQHERLAADIAAMRSDLTQIALILGAHRPEANQA